VSDRQLPESHLDFLVRELQDDASGIVDFERRRGARLLFHDYYSSFLEGPDKARRTKRGCMLRRIPMLDFVDDLKARFGPNPRILDVGCGYGTDTMLLAKLGCRVVAVEPERDFFTGARHRLKYWRDSLGDCPEPEFLVGTLEELTQLQSRSFAGIFVSECLHHCEPVENVLLRMRRLIDSAGRVLALEANAACLVLMWKRNRVAARSRRVLVQAGDVYYLWGNENIRTPRQWQRVFHECGFNTTNTHFNHHVFAELPGFERAEGLTRPPGAALGAIHVTFVLKPRVPAVTGG